MKFKYTAVTAKNKRKTGTVEAADKVEAVIKLKQEKLIPLSVEPAGKALGGSLGDIELFETDIHKKKINKKKLLVILNQMATMLKAGVGLSLIMEVLIDGESNRHIRKMLIEMRNDLFAGVSLSNAMRKFKSFSEVMVNIVAAGEADGRVDSAFEQIIASTEKEITLNSKIKGALVYPIFLLALTVAVLTLLNIVVLPTFIDLFAQLNAELPPITLFVISASNFLSKFWYTLAIFVAAVIFLYRYVRKKSAAFCTKIDELKLKAPAVGKLLSQSYTARFCRVLSSLSKAGVDIMTALVISRSVVPNVYVRNSVEQMAEDVRAGSSIHEAMSRHSFFAPLLISMVRAGEESGFLSESLNKMAELYEDQTDESAKRLTTMLEPAMTVIIAIIVGTVMISIVMPMFGMYTLIQ